MWLKNLRIVRVLGLCAAAAPLAAQQPTVSPAKTGKGEIVGFVADSLNGRYLRGADIILEGSSVHVVTDSLGVFRVPGLEPGNYRVGVFHPMFDTLGISLATKPFHLGPDSTTIVEFAVPSAASIIRRSCTVLANGENRSAVIGRVADADTQLPIAGAEVSIAWVELEVSKKSGITRTPHALRDSTNSAGEFHICGLPNSMDATLKATKGATQTSEIPITLGERDPELLARTLLLSHADSTVTTGGASVSGTVTLEGSPLKSGTRVELLGTDKVAMTNDRGEFTMTDLPSGSHVLVARHLGFGAETAPVDLSARQPQRVAMTLPKFVAVMDPVVVTARRTAGLQKTGFNERMRRGNGYFLGPEQLQKMHPIYLTDIFRRVPGLRVGYSARGETVTSSRGTGFGTAGCVQFFLDDMPWMSATPGDINNFVNAREVVGAEVYQPLNTPPQYTRGMGQCTTVVLWTKYKIRDVSEK